MPFVSFESDEESGSTSSEPPVLEENRLGDDRVVNIDEIEYGHVDFKWSLMQLSKCETTN